MVFNQIWVRGTLLMQGKMHNPPPPPPFPSRHQLSASNCRLFENNNNNNGQQFRLYQVWRGNNRFLLGGRLIFGPDAKSLFLTLFLILTPVILFCAFVSRGLIAAFPHHLGQLVVALGAIFTAYTILLLFLTSGRDPGIIPRNQHPPEPEEEDGDTSSISTDWADTHNAALSIPPPTKNVVINGIVVKVKYCRTCMLYRPPRCSHCSICNNCVDRFDHHCPWVGQCIGKRNYRYFFMFVSSTSLLCLYVFAFCWVDINKRMEIESCDMWTAFLKAPVSGFLIVYTFIVAWFVGGLTVFHLYLIFTNQTTYENFRYRYDRKTNPYNIGSTRNIAQVFFSKIPSSKHNFRAKVKLDCSSLSTNSSYIQRMILSTEIPETSIDLETGKQQAVNEVDIESQVESGRLERWGTQPRSNHRQNWDMITHDIQTAELGDELSVKDKEKINGG